MSRCTAAKCSLCLNAVNDSSSAMLPAGWIPAVHRTAFPFTSLGFSFHTSLCFMSAFCFARYVSLGTRRSSLVNAALSARSGLPAKSSKQHQTFLHTQGWQQGRISPSGSPCPEAVPPAQPCLCPTCNAKCLFCDDRTLQPYLSTLQPYL